jgi:preprotein translocase subunit YajC
MTVSVLVPFALAMASPGQSPQSALTGMIPIALMVAIFYVLVLLPMRKRQKKVQAFQDGLKVGDRIITTSGIYGQIMKVEDKSVQVQIADRIRIEVARAAIGGYQGEEPVVPQGGGSL